MNPVDRFQALIRHPEYRNDPRLQEKRKFELDKFGLPYLFSKNGPLGHWDEEWWRASFAYNGFLRIWGLNHAVEPENCDEVEAALNALRSGDDSIFKDDLRGYDASEDRYKPDSDYGQFFTINIDLERPTKDLLELIRRMIDTKRKERGIKTKRTKPHGIDHWEIWDQMQVPGNNLLVITRALFKVKGNPAYDEKTKKAYDQVQRAYRKADSMIQKVGNCRNKPPSKGSMDIFLPMMEEAIMNTAAGRTDWDAAEKPTIPGKS